MKMLGECEGIIIKVCLAFTDRRIESVRDLYQEIVARLWLGWPRIRHRSHTTVWVYRVAFNTAMSRYERRPVEVVLINEEHLEALAEEVADPATERLYELIDRLDADERRLVLLYLDKVPQSEMAHTLGLSLRTLQRHLNRIVNKLKTMHYAEE